MMKKNLSSLEIHYMLKELKLLVGQKIDQIYHPSKKEILLQFHVTGKGKQLLRIIAGNFFFLTDSKEKHEEPSGFCMFLRKHLSNSRLRDIKQLKSERIVELTFEKKEYKRILIIEFFGKGNIILVDPGYKVLSAVEFHKWKDREIKSKLIYQYPKSKIDIFRLQLKSFKEAISTSDRGNIVKALAVEFGNGGTYSEEICLLSNLDKGKNPEKIDEKEAKTLLDSISCLLGQRINPSVIYAGDILIDAIPFDLKIYSKSNKKEFETFSKALEFYISSKKEPDKTPKQNQIEKLKRIIEAQKSKITELEKQEKQERKKAELIYANYIIIDDILRSIKKAQAKYSWKEIKDKLKTHKTIKELNARDKKVAIDIQ